MTMTVGFIGFGEAGHAVAKGLSEQGVQTRAYDILCDEPAGRAAMHARARDATTVMLDSVAEMLPPCDVVVSAVVTSNCLPAAQSAAPHLRPGQFYMDMNSASPDKKRCGRRAVETGGARYVDAAVMAAVPPYAHRVPILLAGSAAPDLLALLAPAGMQMEVLSNEVGDAAAAKMFQSILIKGTEALLLECLVAASQSGVERRVLDSMSRSTPGFDWVARANYMLGRTAKHGARRADEMDEVVDTLVAMDIDPMVTRGIAQRLHWAAERTHPRREATDMPGYREVIAVLREAELQ
jgi:3-hydroxyisobutyrate dehydrogenase-like beta-hydroxyacid dehydrogenase